VSDQDDRVIDIFSGSNTTGQVAEVEKRRWMSFEQLPEYVATSAFRFLGKGANADVMRRCMLEFWKANLWKLNDTASRAC
jgi:DNA modification methylase